MSTALQWQLEAEKFKAAFEQLTEELAALRAENEGIHDLISEYQSYEQEVIRLREELSALRNTEVTRADLIREMANKLMGWKLPKDFSPDAGISFMPRYNVGTP